MRLRLVSTAAATTLLTLAACSSTESGTKPPETSDTPSAPQTATGTKLADLKICATCKDFSTFVDKQQSKNKAQVVTEGSLDVSDAKVTSMTGGFYTVKEDVNYPAGADINNKTGKEIETFPRETQQYSFDLQWRNGSWTLLEYKARADVKDSS